MALSAVKSNMKGNEYRELVRPAVPSRRHEDWQVLFSGNSNECLGYINPAMDEAFCKAIHGDPFLVPSSKAFHDQLC
jgi:hypothetical protein